MFVTSMSTRFSCPFPPNLFFLDTNWLALSTPWKKDTVVIGDHHPMSMVEDQTHLKHFEAPATSAKTCFSDTEVPPKSTTKNHCPSYEGHNWRLSTSLRHLGTPELGLRLSDQTSGMHRHFIARLHRGGTLRLDPSEGSIWGGWIMWESQLTMVRTSHFLGMIRLFWRSESVPLPD